MNDEHELLDRTRAWISGIKSEFESVAPGADEARSHEHEPFGFKLL
jgi:hypothetical protein